MKNKIVNLYKKYKKVTDNTAVFLLFLVVVTTITYFKVQNKTNLKKEAFKEGFKQGYNKGTESGAKAMSGLLNNRFVDFDKLSYDDSVYGDSILVNYLNQ